MAFGSSAVAADLQTRLRFDPVDLRIRETAGTTEVGLVGLSRVGGDGSPELPMTVSTFLVPEGFEVGEVRVVPRRETRVAEGVRLARGRAAGVAPSPVDSPDDVKRAWPAGALEEGATRIPARTGLSLGAGTMAGHRLHSVAVFPVRWDEAKGDLYLASEIDVELELVPASFTSGLERRRYSPAAEQVWADAVSGIIANPGDVPFVYQGSAASPSGGSPRDLPSVDGTAIDYVIVTTEALADDFAPLAEWKTKKGVPTAIRTIEWIDASYPAGHDPPERIRMFLRDAYSNWGTYLVLLGGDYEIVPPREAYNRFFFGGTQIPTDQYYACLEGDWNGDGDDLFGEGVFQTENGDSVDLYPDVFVGRAPASDSGEVATFIAKSLTYDKAPPADYVEDVCYLGEVLFPENWVYGNPPENITLDGKDLCEDFDLLIPPAWSRTKCYQSDNTLDRAHALTELSAGHHLLTLMNHGDAFKFSVGNGLNPLVYIADSDTLTNGDRLSFLMATACNPNQFDLECQGESFMNNSTGGAIAVVGPTREDFPLSASAFHERMLQLIYDHGITQFGVFMQLHRVAFAPVSGTDATPDRWTTFTKLLLGDPELRLWTQEPAPLVVTHAPSVAVGAASLTVTVTDSSLVPLADALVCVSDTMGTYSRVRTNAAGQAVVPLASIKAGTGDVVVTLREYLPAESALTVTAGVGPVVAHESSTLDDDATGSSNGNGDGQLDAGETVELGLTAHNGGDASADSTVITASVEPGAAVTFDCLWNGVRDSSMVFIGPDKINPLTVPFTLDFANPAIDYIGSPPLTFSPDSTGTDQGIFFWQDREGWHVHWSAGADSASVSGVVSTDGHVRGAAGLFLEDGSDSWSLSAGEDSLSFSGTVYPGDLRDGVDLALADSTMITLTSASALVGDLAAGASGAGTTVFDVASNARDGQLAYVDLTFTSLTGGPWTGVVPLVFSGPSLEAWMFTLDDTTNPPVSGNGNGVAEVGETVRLTPTVLNRGSGSAEAVTGSATAASGVTFTDAADAYGSLASLGMSAGVDGYVFTLDDSTGTSIDLTLTDAEGRLWAKNIEFVAPAPPDSVRFTSSSSEIVVAWDPSPEADFAGYNVYRSSTQGSGHVRENFELVRAGARYVDEDLSIGSTFYYYVTAVDSSGNESPASAELTAWTTLPQVAGWPKSAESNVFPSILMVDADGVDGMEVFVGAKNGKMYGWHADGTEIAGWPVIAGSEVWATPAAADIDGDGDMEIFWGANDSRYYVVHHDGTPVYNGNAVFLDLLGTGGVFRSATTIADVDKDNELEFFFGNDNGKLFAFNADGTGLTDSTGLFFQAPPFGSGSRIWGAIAIGDLENDLSFNGEREICFTSWNDSLYVLDATGAAKPGFPKGAGDDFQSGPALGDIDNDGDLEIVVGNNDGNLYAYHHDGSGVIGGGIFATLPDDIRCVPALCNLDADPELEIVVTCFDGNIYAFNHDGSGFLNAGGLFAAIDPTEAMSASPIVVDIDNDGSFEIFAGHRNGKFYGFHDDGSTIVGFPIPTFSPIFSTASAGDIEGDGDVDIVFASYDNSVNVMDFAGASTDSSYEWRAYGANQWRTSVYGQKTPWQTGSPVVGPASFSFSLRQNTPNPFLGGTTIRYVVPRDMNVSLKVFNVTGQLVRTLADGPVKAGPNRVIWDGRDQRGRRLSSGVYFYRLDNGEQKITRKSLILR